MSASAFRVPEDNKIPKAEAERKIGQMAKDKGLRNTFKVIYDGEVIGDPDDLPEMVDMTLVKVSELLHQAV